MRQTLTRRTVAALFVAAAMFAAFTPAAAHGASDLDDYASRVQEAERLVGAAMPDMDDPAAGQELVEDVRGLLPAGEAVVVNGESVGVSDPVLIEGLDELEGAATTAARTDAAEKIRDRLASIRTTIGVPSSAALATDPAALARILEEERIGDTGMPSWVKQIEDAIREWLAKLLPNLPDMPEPVTKWVLPVMCAIFVLFAALLVWRLWKRGVARRDRFETLDGDGNVVPVVAVAEGLPDDVLSFADRAAAEGRYRDAVRALFGGAARELGERGVLTRTRTRTTGELLHDVMSARASLGGPLGELAAVFEPAWYGHRDPGDAGFGAARSAFVSFSAALEAGDAS